MTDETEEGLIATLQSTLNETPVELAVTRALLEGVIATIQTDDAPLQQIVLGQLVGAIVQLELRVNMLSEAIASR